MKKEKGLRERLRDSQNSFVKKKKKVREKGFLIDKGIRKG
jgi:hypothetical protein